MANKWLESRGFWGLFAGNPAVILALWSVKGRAAGKCSLGLPFGRGFSFTHLCHLYPQALLPAIRRAHCAGGYRTLLPKPQQALALAHAYISVQFLGSHFELFPRDTQVCVCGGGTCLIDTYAISVDVSLLPSPCPPFTRQLWGACELLSKSFCA